MTAVAGGITYSTDLILLQGYTSARPLVRLIQQASQTFTHGTNNALTFGASSEDIDTHLYHDTSTNNTRITPTNGAPAYWRATGTVSMAASSALNILAAFIGKNGSSVQPLVRTKPVAATSTTCSVTVTAIVQLNGSTDYVELYGNQSSTGSVSLATQASGGVNSVFELEFLRPL